MSIGANNQDPLFFILDNKGTVKPAANSEEFQTFFLKERSTWHLQNTINEYTVSTVFTGVASPFEPTKSRKLFETLVFKEDNERLLRKHATWKDANAFHAFVVASLESGITIDSYDF